MPYEDRLGSRPVRKPGYQSPPPRPSPQEAALVAFSKDLIKALEDAAAAPKHAPSPERLAEAAYNKLQYDFPLLSAEELEALVADLRGALDTRRWPRLPLTTKLLENAVEGAAPAAARPGFKAATATNSQAATASAWSSGGKGSSASTDMGNGTRSNGGGGGIDGEPEANSPAEVQVLWQQLAMCVVVKLVRRAMEAPPLEASEQLFRFTVEAHSVAVHPAAAQQQQHEDRSIESLQDALSCTPVSSSVDTELQSRHDGPGVSTKGDTSAALSTGSTTAAPVRTNGTAACRVHNVDGDGISSDDEAYEPLVPLAAAQAAAGQLHAAEAMQQGHHSATAPVPEAHAWPLLLAKVEVIAAHAQHCLMASGAAWRAMSLEDDVVAAIAAAAAHTEREHQIGGPGRTTGGPARDRGDSGDRFAGRGDGGGTGGSGSTGSRGGGLESILLAMVSLLEQRTLDAPEALRVFPALCSSLGAGDSATTMAGSKGVAPGLPWGLRTAVATAARLFEGLPAESSKRTLSAHVQQALLPLLGAWLGRAVAAKAAFSADAFPAAAAAAVSPTAVPSTLEAAQEAQTSVVPAARSEWAASVADIVAVCKLVEATVVAARGGAAKGLLDSGVFRALAALFASGVLSSVPDLGRAILVAVASDPNLAVWAAAVPGLAAAAADTPSATCSGTPGNRAEATPTTGTPATDAETAGSRARGPATAATTVTAATDARAASSTGTGTAADVAACDESSTAAAADPSGAEAKARRALWALVLPPPQRPPGGHSLTDLLSLGGPAAEEPQVQALLVTLQLLASCSAAAGGRRLWDASTDAALRALAAPLASLSARASDAAAEAKAAAVAADPSLDHDITSDARDAPGPRDAPEPALDHDGVSPGATFQKLPKPSSADGMVSGTAAPSACALTAGEVEHAPDLARAGGPAGVCGTHNGGFMKDDTAPGVEAAAIAAMKRNTGATHVNPKGSATEAAAGVDGRQMSEAVDFSNGAGDVGGDRRLGTAVNHVQLRGRCRECSVLLKMLTSPDGVKKAD